jgi:hypothetical protein
MFWTRGSVPLSRSYRASGVSGMEPRPGGMGKLIDAFYRAISGGRGSIVAVPARVPQVRRRVIGSPSERITGFPFPPLGKQGVGG